MELVYSKTVAYSVIEEMEFKCFHEFRPQPPMLPGALPLPPYVRLSKIKTARQRLKVVQAYAPNHAKCCPFHYDDVLRRQLFPPTAVTWQPKDESFLVTISLPNDLQKTHQAAHLEVHRQAALRQENFFCQTCGKTALMREDVKISDNFDLLGRILAKRTVAESKDLRVVLDAKRRRPVIRAERSDGDLREILQAARTRPLQEPCD